MCQGTDPRSRKTNTFLERMKLCAFSSTTQNLALNDFAESLCLYSSAFFWLAIYSQKEKLKIKSDNFKKSNQIK
jgi:hypothetical protein